MAQSPTPLPLLYRLFFLYIEPVSTAAGAYYGFLRQAEYFTLTHPAAAGVLGVTTRESIVLYQLANMYLAFALNEAFVLRATTDLRVWRVFLLGLLIADFGHLYSVHAMGWPVYYRFWEWNAMYWGNLGFVYVGASFRISFLLGLGLQGQKHAKARA